MTKLLMVLSMVISFNVSALELRAYKSTSSNIVKLDDSAVEAVWAGNVPACLKDGARIMGVNKAFTDKKLGYSDCSQSDNAKEKARMLGYEVRVIKFTELSDKLAKSIKK